MDTDYEAAARALDAILDGLRRQAEEVVTAHVEAARAKDKNLPWTERSNMRIFIRDGKVYEWSRIKWYGPKGARKMVRFYIAKPRGAHMYSLSKLLAHAQPWEAPMVEETERRLAALRKQQTLVTKARLYLRLAMKAAHGDEDMEGEHGEEEQIDS